MKSRFFFVNLYVAYYGYETCVAWDAKYLNRGLLIRKHKKT